MTHVALIVKEDGLIYVNEVPEEPEYCREFKGTDCQGSECHCMLHKIRYDRALASAKENAVLCADQEQAKTLILRNHRIEVDLDPIEFTEGIYPIPDLQWERKGICCSPMPPNINHHGYCDECPGYSELSILTLSEQPKGELFKDLTPEICERLTKHIKFEPKGEESQEEKIARLEKENSDLRAQLGTDNEPDFEWDDDGEDDGNPDYWECCSCNYTCGERPAWGGQCPKCGSHMEEGYF